MRMMHWLVAAAGLATISLTLPAQAAPTGAVTGNAANVQDAGTGVELVRHRCYRHRGHWHCPKHKKRYYYYGYAPYYYGPGISLHFGGGRHGHHHGGKHRGGKGGRR